MDTKAIAWLFVALNMTLKGQRNHYNVKYLRGYGTSITLKDHRACLKNGNDNGH